MSAYVLHCKSSVKAKVVLTYMFGAPAWWLIACPCSPGAACVKRTQHEAMTFAAEHVRVWHR